MILRLKELINDSNDKVEDLMNYLQIKDVSQIYQWIRGDNNPNADNLVKIAIYFNCSIDYLVGRTENNDKFPSTLTSSFAERLQEIMKNKNVTQYKMIKENVVSGINFHRWFKLKAVPQLDTLIKLADYFGVSIDYLVGRE